MSVSFSNLSEKVHAAPIKLNMLAWCPTMDLLAMISDSEEISLYRLSGQRVWSMMPRVAGKIKAVPCKMTWRLDSKVLVVCFTSGDLQFLDVNDGKVVSQVEGRDLPQALQTKPIVLRWMEHAITTKHNKLYTYDIREQLPRLAVLPYSGLERNFTSDQAIDSLIHDIDKQSRSLQFLAFGYAAFDFMIGSFRVRMVDNASEASDMIDYRATADLTKHVILEQDREGLILKFYKLLPFSDLDPALQANISTYNEFEMISAYLEESLGCLAEECHVIESTRRKSLQKLVELAGDETIAKCDLLTLLMTGSTSVGLKEWFDEWLSDRLVRKWEKTCQTALENMRKIVLDASLPACDRLVIMLSKLQKFYAPSSDSMLGAVTQQDRVQQTLTSTALLITQLYQLLQSIASELRCFSAFCSWIVFTNARLQDDDESMDALLPTSITLVSDYIQSQFPEGLIAGYCDEGTESDRARNTLRAQCKQLITDGKTIFLEPARSLSRMWDLEATVPLISGTEVLTESTIDEDGDTRTLYMMVSRIESGKSRMSLIRTNLHSFTTSACQITFQDELDSPLILDMKFIGNEELLLLLKTRDDDRAHLIAVNYKSLTCEDTELSSSPILDAVTTSCPALITKRRTLETGTNPVCLAVNSAEGRRTGLYLQNDRQRYTIFDLDDQDDDEMSADYA